MGFSIKKWLKDDDSDVFSTNNVSEEEFYNIKSEEALEENNGGSKMILLEPRAYSEASEIGTYLKQKRIKKETSLIM